jgi:Polypeptide deformylase
MDLAKKDESKEPRVFINPEVTWISAEQATHEEGCLSIPEYYEEVERPKVVKVRYLDLEGKPQEIEATDLLAIRAGKVTRYSRRRDAAGVGQRPWEDSNFNQTIISG